MKKIFIVGNWKSNKTVGEGYVFITSFFSKNLSRWIHQQTKEKERIVVLCPPFTLLAPLREALNQFDNQSIKIVLGAQDISPFDSGPHTGQESGQGLKEFVSYVIVGHSEARSELKEEESILAKKVIQAEKFGIEPIFCVQGKDNVVPPGVRMIAFEPVEAIGSGRPYSPSEIEEVAKFYKENKDIHYCLYGGSVTIDNVGEIVNLPSIDGVLVGGASLDPKTFSQIVMRT